MQPEETLQAHLDLRDAGCCRSTTGTLDLALHAWEDPFERIAALASSRVALTTPVMGNGWR